MSFPDLVLKTNSRYNSSAQGTPDNGNNEFAHGIDAVKIQNHPERLIIEVTPLGPSIEGATYVSLSADYTMITVNFTQYGSDQALVEARLLHSSEW